MKSYLLFLLTFFEITACNADDFDMYLNKGKTEFKNHNFSAAADDFEKATKLRPDNPEAHYFLGYSYSKLNSSDGTTLPDVNLPLTIKASDEFETVNRLSPKYTGEIIVLDPYSKITSDWGAMAMSYMVKNKPDSAIWAFREGKKRGGFGDFFLSMNRAVLDICNPDAILISSGDNFSFALFYLQMVEGYRGDVAVIDISLLQTKWFPSYLIKNQVVHFDLPAETIDAFNYIPWKDSLISIPDLKSKTNFTWVVKPDYNGKYISGGDQVFLSILRANEFQRDIYFTTTFQDNLRLNLSNNLSHLILVDKLNTADKEELSLPEYTSAITKILALVKNANLNSQQELNFIDVVRYDILNRMNDKLRVGDKNEAIKLFSIMDKYVPENKYPFQAKDGEKYAHNVIMQVQ